MFSTFHSRSSLNQTRPFYNEWIICQYNCRNLTPPHPPDPIDTHTHTRPLPVCFPLGQRQNTALPNRGRLHLPVRPWQPLAELQASLHVVRDAQGWWPWMACPSQVSPAHLNCMSTACNAVFVCYCSYVHREMCKLSNNSDCKSLVPL